MCLKNALHFQAIKKKEHISFHFFFYRLFLKLFSWQNIQINLKTNTINQVASQVLTPFIFKHVHKENMHEVACPLT